MFTSHSSASISKTEIPEEREVQEEMDPGEKAMCVVLVGHIVDVRWGGTG